LHQKENAMSTTSWASFYAGRGDDYLAYVKTRYRPMIDVMASAIETGDTILEIGAGTGTITKALIDELQSPHLYDFIATDIDAQMRSKASLRLASTSASVREHDARQPTPFYADIVHSHGMLEHFDDDTIRQVIEVHRAARWQFHYVPGLYPSPSFGDERLMSASQWVDICEPTSITHFNDGLDYLLVFDGPL
jgi:SAM-dependent methyltransferase